MSGDGLHLAQGLLRRGDRVLLVASKYPNHAAPLWHLPGGRRRDCELLPETLRRECREEIGADVRVGDVLYVSESFDTERNIHVLAVTFDIQTADEPSLVPGDAHVREVAWVPVREVAARIAVGVVRDPLVAHLRGSGERYFGFRAADVSIVFSDDA